MQPGPGGGRPGGGAASPPGGSLGGIPGIGGPTSPGGGGRPGGFGGTGGGGAFAHDPTRSLVVVIPIEEDLSVGTPFYHQPGNATTNPIWRPKLHFNHRGQRFVTNLFSDDASIQWYADLLKVPTPRSTRLMEVKELHRNWTKSKSDPKMLFTVLTRALEAGMVDDLANNDDAVAYADELLAYATAKPEGLPADIAAFAKAYKAMQKGIKSPPAKPTMAELWKSRLDAQGVHTQGHYSLIYWDASSSEVQRRAAMLEENLKGFYLWHATRGIELPTPDAPLIVVLAKSAQAVYDLARALDGPARLTADGFYSLDHDVLVLSPERLDEVGQTFVRQAQQIYKTGVTREDLLAGKGPKLHKYGDNGGKRPEEVARMQTLALVDRLLEDESAIAAISREGSRQLMYASGLLPRYVSLPDWLAHGSSNFFTRPKDPAFITTTSEDKTSTAPEHKTAMAVALTTGYGSANYTLQRYFKDLMDNKELNPDRAALLKNVLTDAYFRGLNDPKEVQDPDPAKADSGIALYTQAPTAPPGPGAFGGSSGGGMRPGGSSGGYGYGSGSGGRPGGGASAGGGRPGGGISPGGGIGGVGSVGGAGFGGAGGIFGGGFGTQPSSVPLEEDPTSLLRKKRERLGIKAQATAWALYYYLAKERPTELRRFLDSLAVLPRDLPLDGDTVLALFCQSMKLDGSKASLNQFATEWLEFIRTVPPAAIVPDIALNEPKANTTTSPGGFGPFGPGGGQPGGGDR